MMKPKNFKKKKALQEVIVHAERMKVAVDFKRRKCVDGGYRENEAVGAIAIPGADLGASMALLSLGFPPQEAFDLVYDFLIESNKPYCWHTDTHEGDGKFVVGCGHCNAAIQSAEHYGLASQEVLELLGIVRRAQKERPNMEMVRLNREHAEKGILIVASVDFTVKPWDEKRGNQYFVYDKTRHLAFLRSLAEFASQRGIEISYNLLVSVSDRQTNATLGLLASSRGKPLYSVDVSGDKPMAAYIGDAPVIE